MARLVQRHVYTQVWQMLQNMPKAVALFSKTHVCFTSGGLHLHRAAGCGFTALHGSLLVKRSLPSSYAAYLTIHQLAAGCAPCAGGAGSVPHARQPGPTVGKGTFLNLLSPLSPQPAAAAFRPACKPSSGTCLQLPFRYVGRYSRFCCAYQAGATLVRLAAHSADRLAGAAESQAVPIQAAQVGPAFLQCDAWRLLFESILSRHVCLLAGYPYPRDCDWKQQNMSIRLFWKRKPNQLTACCLLHAGACW